MKRSMLLNQDLILLNLGLKHITIPIAYLLANPSNPQAYHHSLPHPTSPTLQITWNLQMLKKWLQQKCTSAEKKGCVTLVMNGSHRTIGVSTNNTFSCIWTMMTWMNCDQTPVIVVHLLILKIHWITICLIMHLKDLVGLALWNSKAQSMEGMCRFYWTAVALIIFNSQGWHIV